MGILASVAASELLRSNRKCTHVSLVGNHLDTEAAAAFVQGLAVMDGMECLTELNLSCNLIRLSNLIHAGHFFRGLGMLEDLR